jgi:hypothetical protein
MLAYVNKICRTAISLDDMLLPVIDDVARNGALVSEKRPYSW